MERPRHPVNLSRARGGTLPRARGATLAAALLLLGGCDWLPRLPTLPALPGADLFDSPRVMRGQAIDQEDLNQITVGVTTRNDVAALLGTPTATGTFDDENWYYISAVTRQRPGRQLAVYDQQVVAISFDQRDTVRAVRRLTQEDARPVQVVQRETPSPGNERTILQQLFSNLGRLGPGVGNIGQQSGPGAPAPR